MTSSTRRFVVSPLALALPLTGVLLLGAATAAFAATLGSTTLVSQSTGGSTGDSGSTNPEASSDGRYVVFQSDAENLVAGDTNGVTDIFLRDTVTGETRRVNVSSAGAEADLASSSPTISADGAWIAYSSVATTLVASDSNVTFDVFLYDVENEVTTRIVAPGGTQLNGASVLPSISQDGRYVAFQSDATNAVAGDSNSQPDIFRYDRTTGDIIRVNVDSSGTQANATSSEPSISGDGNRVAFLSFATNLIASDTNARTDVFLRDVTAGTTVRVSESSSGTQANDTSYSPSISQDGAYVAFASTANNLVGFDNNNARDIFRYRVSTAATAMVSFETNGSLRSRTSFAPAISADGRLVVYTSFWDPTYAHVWLYDTQTASTLQVDLLSNAAAPDISGDGTRVVYADAGQLYSTGVSVGPALSVASTATAGVAITASVSDAGTPVTGNYTFSTSDSSATVSGATITFRTAGVQTVTATPTAGGTTLTANVNVGAGATTTLTPTLSTTTPTAGDTVTVTAVTGSDAFGNSTGDLTAQSEILSTTDSAAVISGLDVELRTAGGRTITVALTATPSVRGSASVTVAAGAAAGLTVTVTPTTVTAGGSVSIASARTVDAFGNVIATVTAASEILSTTDAQAVIAGGGGSVSLRTAGSQTITVALSSDTSITGTATVTVNPGTVTAITPTLSTAAATAGDTVTVTAVSGSDAYGNARDVTTLSRILSTTDSAASISGRTTVLRTAGSTTVTVSLIANTSISATRTVTVSAGAVAALRPTLSPTSVTAGDTVTVTAVRSVDAFGNDIADVTADAEIRSTTDASAVITGLAAELRRAGSTTVTVQLTANTAIRGTATATVAAAAPVSLAIKLSSTTVNQGGSLTFTVIGTDPFGNEVNLTSSAVVTSSVPTDVITTGRITFPHASPHTITATAAGLTATALVEVTPRAELGATGLEVTGALLLGGLVLAGGVLLTLGAAARRRRA